MIYRNPLTGAFMTKAAYLALAAEALKPTPPTHPIIVRAPLTAHEFKVKTRSRAKNKVARKSRAVNR